MSSRTSLPRRLAVPLCLSLLAHGLLIGMIALVLRAPPPAADAADARPAFSIRLGSLEKQRPGPKSSPGDPEEEKWEPILVNVNPLPAAVSELVPSPGPVAILPGGPPSPGAGVGLGSGASRGGRGLLTAPATARRVVYLLDRSMSMGPSGALAAARREIADSLRRLPPSALFQIIAYNNMAEPFELDGQRQDLSPAAPAVIEQAIHQLDDVQASGPTDHARAIRCALLLRTHPELLFLITDAGNIEPRDVPALQRLFQGRTILHVVELSHAHPGKPTGLLATLAEGTGGSYRRIPPDR